MINSIERILDVGETKLRYQKKETMKGLYFQEMLSKAIGSKPKQEKHKKEDGHKEENPSMLKQEYSEEGNFVDKLC